MEENIRKEKQKEQDIKEQQLQINQKKNVAFTPQMKSSIQSPKAVKFSPYTPSTTIPTNLMIRQQYQQQQQQLSPQNSPVLPPVDFKFQTIQPFDLLLDSIITFYEDISRAYFLFRTNIVALPQPVVIFAAIAQGNYVAVNRLLEIIQRHITDPSILHNQADAILKGLVLVFMGFFDLTYLIPIDDEDDDEEDEDEESIQSISDEDEEDDDDEKGKGFKKKRNGNIVKFEGNKNKNSNKNKQKKKKRDQTI
ncbi:MAG: hypothetical protein EZS28_048770, partial [Streblomastix strix]